MSELKNLATAVISVMKAIKGIDKSMTVGSGTMSYKGVSDQLVKQTIGEEMEKNGLCILPIGVEAKNQIDRWEETNQYGVKQKQSVFVEVITKYLLLHESGESVELSGYGHGTDPQDKAAGKATTYALKYTLLYTFMVATGKIDDADNEHSEDKQVVPPKQELPPPIIPETVVTEINAATTKEKLVEIWNTYKTSVSNKLLQEAIGKKRDTLTA